MEFGETDFKNLVIGDFEGDLDKTSTLFSRLMSKAVLVSDKLEVTQKDTKRHISAISSRDAELHHLYAKTMDKPTHKSHIDLSSEINDRMRADHVFEDFAGVLTDDQKFPLPRDFDCLKNMMRIYEEECGKFSDYALKYIKYLVKECETVPVPAAIDGSIHRLRKACSH